MSDKKKVLIIEDEPSLQGALEAKLAHEGYAVVSAKNGEEGLQTALSEKPDLILLDIIMPHMDGLHMLKQLRKDPWGKSVHVMILTNIQEPEKISEAAEQGAYEYLVKSDWTLEDLLKKIKESF